MKQLMVYFKRKQQQQQIARQRRQQQQHQHRLLQELPSSIGVVDHIAVGSFYEIDHSKLPLRTPEQLKRVRVIMVSDKTESEVSLRFPSIYSVRAYFDDGKSSSPALDEKHVMESEVSAEVLFRRITAEELVERKGSWDFWFAGSSLSSADCGFVSDSKMGSCWSELKGTGMVHWVNQRKVCFLRRHDEVIPDDEGMPEDEKTVDENEEEEVKVEPSLTRELRKRKTESDDKQRGKKVKVENNEVKRNGQFRKKATNHINRWSAERYNLAEENILKVLKEKNAMFGNPILRPALRSEARKLIGDTGLLDHLLKHMAGKVAPGGNERFRRRHNADGAMEYWLESADLMNIRKEAGVQDPYWTPPPGWKPGDNPTQDPVIAREIRQLKEEMANMKDLKEEMSKMMEEMKKVITEKQGQDVTVVTTQSCSVTSQNIDQDDALVPLKEKYLELHERKAKIKEELTQLSKSLSQLEGEMAMLMSTEQDNRLDLLSPFPILQLSYISGGDQETEAEENKGLFSLSEQQNNANKDILNQAAKDKAAKIERLKSGFKICKPQGTFLWPNMAMSPHSLSHVEDIINIPTPQSASSSTSLPQLLQDALQRPPSPVKPLAEKRVLPVTPAQSKSSIFIDVKTPNLNLNEMPCILNTDVTSSKERDLIQ